MTKTSPDTMVDRATMLLSTDWFAPYWSVIGIDADTQNQAFQNGCREIVLQLTGTAMDYYLIDFSAARIENTRERLRTLTRNCAFAGAALARLDELVMYKSGREQLQKTAWLFGVVHQELLRDHELDEPIKLAIAQTWRKSSLNDDLDLEQICLQSATRWDQYIRNLTPDVPASLAHVVTTDLLPVAKLTDVLGQLSESQRELLHLRFRTIAKSVTGVDMERDWAGFR